MTGSGELAPTAFGSRSIVSLGNTRGDETARCFGVKRTAGTRLVDHAHRYGFEEPLVA
jgi:hypothetical protein